MADRNRYRGITSFVKRGDSIFSTPIFEFRPAGGETVFWQCPTFTYDSRDPLRRWLVAAWLGLAVVVVLVVGLIGVWVHWGVALVCGAVPALILAVLAGASTYHRRTAKATGYRWFELSGGPADWCYQAVVTDRRIVMVVGMHHPRYRHSGDYRQVAFAADELGPCRRYGLTVELRPTGGETPIAFSPDSLSPTGGLDPASYLLSADDMAAFAAALDRLTGPSPSSRP